MKRFVLAFVFGLTLGSSLSFADEVKPDPVRCAAILEAAFDHGNFIKIAESYSSFDALITASKEKLKAEGFVGFKVYEINPLSPGGNTVAAADLGEKSVQTIISVMQMLLGNGYAVAKRKVYVIGVKGPQDTVVPNTFILSGARDPVQPGFFKKGTPGLVGRFYFDTNFKLVASPQYSYVTWWNML